MKLTFASCAFALLLATQAHAQSDAALAVSGKAIVAKHCARCHQIEATGQSRLPLAPPFRDLMQRYEPEDLEEALGEGIVSGHPSMPAFKFEPDDVAAIVAYFATLRGTR